jgi:hypothetical protein
MKKKLPALILAATLVAPGAAFADSTIINNGTINNSGLINNGTIIVQFNDIQANNWAYPAITSMSERGIVSGYSDGSFRPDNPISREEFAKMISATFSLDLSVTDAVYYSDVSHDRWSYPYIAATTEYITGYYPPKGIAFFDPAANATREDVATALVKIAGLSTSKYSSHFKDEDLISPGLTPYINVAAGHKLISGYEDGSFRPLNPITRAEVATLLYRAIKGISSLPDSTDSVQPTTPSAPSSPTLPTKPNIPAPDLYVDVIQPATKPVTSGVDSSTQVTVLVKGETTPGAKVTVNGESILTDAQGSFSHTVPITHGGTYSYEIISTYMGKSTTVNKSITVKIDAPKLSLGQPDPQSLPSNTVNLWFSWIDANDAQPTLYVNGEKRKYGTGGAGPASGQYNGVIELLLQDGENSFTLKVVNRYGIESNAVTKVYFYQL